MFIFRRRASVGLVLTWWDAAAQVGKQTISLDGVAKCNLNLMVNLINRKFYSSSS